MATTVAIIAAIVSVLGGLTGVGTAILNWRMHRHTVERDKVQDYFSSYQDDIANLERLCEALPEGAEKEETKGEIVRLRRKQHEEREAWRQKQELAALIPGGAITTDRPRLPPAVMEKVRALLAGSERLPPVLLTEYDYVMLGTAYVDVGEHQRAVDALGRALALGLEPELQRISLFLRAVALFRLQRYDDALNDCDAALADALDPDGLEIRGVVRTKLELYEEALRDFERALELSPRNLEVRYNRACTTSLMGDFHKALPDLEAAIQGNEKYRELARADEDFEKLRNDPEYGPRFRALVGE